VNVQLLIFFYFKLLTLNVYYYVHLLINLQVTSRG
jgi:hypothetical protein